MENERNVSSLKDLTNVIQEPKAALKYAKSMGLFLIEEFEMDTKMEVREPVESFCEDGFFVGDYIEPSYEDATESVICAHDAMELIAYNLFEAIEKKRLKRELPHLAITHSLTMFENAWNSVNMEVEQEHRFFDTEAERNILEDQTNFENEDEENDEFVLCDDFNVIEEEPERICNQKALSGVEPCPMGADNWVRLRIKKYISPSKAIPKWTPKCFGPQDTTIFKEASLQLKEAKDSVKCYIENTNLEKPKLEQIAYKIEVPSEAEAALRALKELRTKKEEQRAKMKKSKLDGKNSQNKRMLLQSKSTLTYDYEGNLIAVKPPKETKSTNTVNFHTPVAVTKNAILEQNDPNNIFIPRAVQINAAYKLPNLISQKQESVKKNLDISEKDPFDKIELSGGVKMRYGNKEKLNPAAPV